jgi:hypothetical protein
MAGLEGHYKRQGLSVPVRSVSPFSDPSSNLSAFPRCGAVGFAAGQHGPDYPCVLIGDRDRCTVVAAPQAKFVDPHTPCIGFSHGRTYDSSGTMYKQGSQVLAAALADAHHYVPLATGMLARGQAQPGRQMTAVLKVGAVANRGDHRR